MQSLAMQDSYKDFVRIINVHHMDFMWYVLAGFKTCSNFPGSLCGLFGLWRDRTEHIAEPLLLMTAAEKLIQFRKRQKCVKWETVLQK